jgi:DNA-binding CsgD family transcriptional regulator
VVANYGFDPELVRLYNQHYITVDPVNRVGRNMRPGELVASNHLMRDEEWMRTEIYTDLSRRYGVFYILGSLLDRGADGYAGVAVLRSRRAGPFQGEVEACFQRFVPHLQRAVAVQRRLIRAESRAATLDSLLDRLDLAVLVLDSNGRVTHVNGAADGLLRQNDGLHVWAGQLTCASSSESAALRALIQGAMDRGDSGLPAGGATIVTRPSGRAPLQVEVTPLTPPGAEGDAVPRIVGVMVNDPVRKPPAMTSRLIQSYGLTPAEARLVEILAGGSSLQEASEHLGVTVHTVRTQLRAVFDKTGTRRQSELVRLVLASPFARVQRGQDAGE